MSEDHRVFGAQYSDIGPVEATTGQGFRLRPFEPSIGTDLQDPSLVQYDPLMIGNFRLGQSVYFIVEVENSSGLDVSYAIKPWWLVPRDEYLPGRGFVPSPSDWTSMCKRLDISSPPAPPGYSLSQLLDEVWYLNGIAPGETRRVAFVEPSHGFGFGVTTQVIDGPASGILTRIYFAVGVTNAIIQESIG